MDKFIKLKHWQVFIYLIIVPAFIPDNETGEYIFVIYGFLFIAWLLKINEELHKRLPKGVNLNLTLLQINLVISFLYIAAIHLFTDGYHISSEQDNYAIYGWKMWVYIPFTFYILYSYAYSIHFTAYSIHTIEKRLYGKSTEYTALLLGLFFFPIGIWTIQPKINRILRMPVTEEIASI
ncbi:hypothetical protein ACXYMU_19520 [Pontibacter sp. CAU 1760]